MSDMGPQRGSKRTFDQVAVTNRDFMSESERDDSARDREQSLLGRRQLGTVIAARCPKNMFYNWPGRYGEMRAFSGSAWKTHVLDGASKVAEIRNCSESSRRRPVHAFSVANASRTPPSRRRAAARSRASAAIGQLGQSARHEWLRTQLGKVWPIRVG